MPLYPHEEALLASLDAVAAGQVPNTAPSLSDLESWGLANVDPIGLTGLGHQVRGELLAKKLTPVPSKSIWKP